MRLPEIQDKLQRAPPQLARWVALIWEYLWLWSVCHNGESLKNETDPWRNLFWMFLTFLMLCVLFFYSLVDVFSFVFMRGFNSEKKSTKRKRRPLSNGSAGQWVSSTLLSHRANRPGGAGFLPIACYYQALVCVSSFVFYSTLYCRVYGIKKAPSWAMLY